MNKKGFTLIELLAVIVILAIIALIATPTILGVIEKARKGAASSSALSYAEALEQYIVTSELDTSKTKLNAGKYDVSAINDLVELKGNKPTSGYVTINSKGEVEAMEVAVNGYLVTCDSNTCETQNKIESEYKAYAVGDQVTIDGISYHVTKTSTKSNEYVTLLRDESIGNMAFDENGGTDFETSTLKAYLDSTYKETFGDKQKYIKEITLLDFGNDDYSNGHVNLVGSEEGTYTNLYKNYRDIFFSSSQSQGAVTSCLYNEQTGKYDICTNIYTISAGLFWTKTASSETFVIDGIIEVVNSDTNEHFYYQISTNDVLGSAAESSVYDENGNGMGIRVTYDSGVRPVIVISKKALD